MEGIHFVFIEWYFCLAQFLSNTQITDKTGLL
jgi:hypothetical protein